MNKCVISQIEWNHFSHHRIIADQASNGRQTKIDRKFTLDFHAKIKDMRNKPLFPFFTSSRSSNLLLHSQYTVSERKREWSKHVSNKITTQWFCQMCQTHFYGHFSLLTYRILIITTRLLFFSAKKWSIHFQWLIHKLTPILDFTISI